MVFWLAGRFSNSLLISRCADVCHGGGVCTGGLVTGDVHYVGNRKGVGVGRGASRSGHGVAGRELEVVGCVVPG